MKMKYLIFVLLLVTFTVQCKKEKQHQDLPRELREEFNCYLNGEYWTKNPGGNCHQLHARYYEAAGSVGANPQGYLVVRGVDCDTDNAMYIVLDSVETTGTYFLPENDYNCGFHNMEAVRLDTLDIYPFEHFYYFALSGHVKITHLEPTKYEDAISPEGIPFVRTIGGWLQGTYEMILINDISQDTNMSVPDTLTITNGKFAAIL